MIRKWLNPEEFWMRYQDTATVLMDMGGGEGEGAAEHEPEKKPDGDPGKKEDPEKKPDDKTDPEKKPEDNEEEEEEIDVLGDQGKKPEEEPDDTEEELDFGLVTKEELEKSKEVEENKDTPAAVLSQASKELGFNLPEGQEAWTPETFIQATKEQIENSRKKLNLEEYDPEVKTMFDFIQNNEGSLVSLAMDDTIRTANELMMLPPEDFYVWAFEQEMKQKGWADSVIQTSLETELSKYDSDEAKEKALQEFKNTQVEQIIKPAVNDRIKEISAEKAKYHERIREREKETFETRKKTALETLDKITDIAGIPMNTQLREFAKKNIETDADFKSLMEDPEIIIGGYLFKHFNKRIADIYKDVIEKREQSSYHEGIRKMFLRGHGKGSGKGKGNGEDSRKDKPVDVELKDTASILFSLER